MAHDGLCIVGENRLNAPLNVVPKHAQVGLPVPDALCQRPRCTLAQLRSIPAIDCIVVSGRQVGVAGGGRWAGAMGRSRCKGLNLVEAIVFVRLLIPPGPVIDPLRNGHVVCSQPLLGVHQKGRRDLSRGSPCAASTANHTCTPSFIINRETVQRGDGNVLAIQLSLPTGLRRSSHFPSLLDISTTQRETFGGVLQTGNS